MEKVAKKKDMRVDELAILMAKGFKRADKKMDDKIDQLAIIVAGSFEKMGQRMDKRFDGLENDVKEVKEDVAEINIGNYSTRIDRLEDGMRIVKTALKIK